MQGVVLSSFYYGYLVTQVPGGALAERYGGKRIFLASVFFSSLFTCLGPVAARVSPILLCVVRAAQGLAEGPVFPTMYAMGAKWLPKQEKSFLMACLVTGLLPSVISRGSLAKMLCITGATAGTCFSLVMSGYLCSHASWDWAFYFFGIMGFVACILFAYFCYDSPENHPRISQVRQ